MGNTFDVGSAIAGFISVDGFFCELKTKRKFSSIKFHLNDCIHTWMCCAVSNVERVLTTD